jgi:hypothetical protein
MITSPISSRTQNYTGLTTSHFIFLFNKIRRGEKTKGNFCGFCAQILSWKQLWLENYLKNLCEASQELHHFLMHIMLQGYILTIFSELFRRNKALIKELSAPPPGSKDLYFPTRYSQSFFTQCMACLWKQHWSYWRNPPYNAVRLLSTTVIALMFGTIFWNLGSKRYREVQHILYISTKSPSFSPWLSN